MERTSKIKDIVELNEKVAYLMELQASIENLQEAAEIIKDQIKEYMGDEQLIKTEDYEVRWTNVSSNRFDQTAFKNAHPDMFESFKRLSESRRFSVTDRE